MESEQEIRSGIVDIGRHLFEKRFITATEGNISVRRGNRLYITPSGECKGLLTPLDIVETDLTGVRISGTRDPSSEAVLHTAIYAARPEVRAVVHAHPPHATAFAVAGIALDRPVLPEVIVTIGEVPLAPYATPGTSGMADSIRDLIRHHDALLLANHGAVTCGTDLRSAWFNMEILEHFAWICAIARTLGNIRELTPEQVSRLRIPD